MPKHPDNRALDYGVEGYTGSSRDLAGDAAAVYQPGPAGHVVIRHLACGAGPAYCRLRRQDGTTETATAPIAVAGCDGTR